MRILHLLSSTAFHGAESMTLQLALAQRRRGDQPAVALLETTDDANDAIAARFASAGIPTRRLACRGRLDFQLVRQLRQLVTSGEVELLHSHKYKATFHALLAARGRVPLIATYHNWVLTDRSLRLYAAIDKQLARWCTACVGVSAAVCTELRRFVPAARVHQVANGIDLDYWVAPADTRARFGVPEDVPVIGFVGRLSEEKGVPLLIDALAKLPSVAGREAHLLLAGGGVDRAALEARAAALGLTARVHFAGEVTDTRAVYGAADLIALPSLTEGLPMTALEAMACERPLVATRVGELPSLIVPGETGELLDRRDPDEFARIVAGMLVDERRLRTMGAAARRKIAAAYSALEMSEAYAGIYAGIGRGH